MYNFRQRHLSHPERQNHPVGLEISATHEHLPQLGENWANRWCSLPNDFADAYDRLWNLNVRDDDVYVVTFMKCGTTWMREAVWLLMNNLDFVKAMELHSNKRSPFLDFIGLLKSSPTDTIEVCNNLQSPRLIHTHLPVNLLPKEIWTKKPKIVYVARNLKDVIVSYYYFVTGLGWWTGNINEFVEDFLNDDVMYAPYWPHIVDFWKLRHEPNICFLTYEDMKRDLGAVLQKLCDFLGRPQLTAEELKTAVEHLSFKSMKDNESTNITQSLKKTVPTSKTNLQFMRRGELGAYKDDLSPENLEKISNFSQAFLAKHDIREEDIFGSIY